MFKRPFEDYSLDDFVADESFVNYQLHSNEKDRIFWEQWLETNPSKKALAAEAGEIINSFSLALNDKEYNEEFEKIRNTINKNDSPSLFGFLNWNKNSQTIRRKRISVQYLIFGILLLAISTAYLFKHQSVKSKPQLSQIVKSGNKTITFTMSDNTVITLFPNSTLLYPSAFQGKARQVYLDGQASFNVKRNEHFPFKVHTKNIVATVLGTIFNIKRQGDSAIVVELLKGRVNVEIEDSSTASSQPVLLYPSEKATYVFHDMHLYKNLYHDFYDITFHQNSFEEIAENVKNIFGKTLINQSSKRNWRFTGDFKNTTAKEIVENICLVKNLNSHAAEDTIFITN